MPDKEIICITAASGKQATNLLPHLARNPQLRLRLVVNSQRSWERFSSKFSDAEVVMTDLMRPDDCRNILKGVSSLHHVGPPVHAHETTLEYHVIDAAIAEAKEGTFKHFVYSSVMNTQLRKLLNHDCKRYVKEYLIESGLNYTILNPTNTTEWLPISQWLQDDKPVWKSIHDPKWANSLLALRDLGEAAAAVITEQEKHYFAKYDCASTMPVPYAEVVPRIGKVIGKDIQIEWLSYPDAVKARLAGGLGGESASQGVRDIV